MVEKKKNTKKHRQANEDPEGLFAYSRVKKKSSQRVRRIAFHPSTYGVNHQPSDEHQCQIDRERKNIRSLSAEFSF